MATKRQRRNVEIRTRQSKKKMKKSLLVFIVTVLVGFLVFLFLTIYDYVYPPVDGSANLAKKKEKLEVTLYFSDANERFLVPEKRFIPKEDTTTSQAREIVKALLDGSKTGFVNTFPDKVEVLNVRIDGKTAFVSFSKNLVKQHPGGSASEMASIYSLTNTLTENIPEIKNVKILVAGKEIPSLKGHIDTRNPFTPNREL
ncbi:MAG: GerMN domain-containing protein, partial [Syntrophales bacterium]|nr:GerMN domain-containing protein [Syntrophales bacterium]